MGVWEAMVKGLCHQARKDMSTALSSIFTSFQGDDGMPKPTFYYLSQHPYQQAMPTHSTACLALASSFLKTINKMP